MSEIRGSSVVILGYGREGKSAHRWLVKHHPELSISVADRNPVQLIAEASKETPVFSGENYSDILASADTIVRSPGISLNHDIFSEAKENGAHITSLSNLFMASAPGKVVGITGTKGKSTTASLIHSLLKEELKDVRLGGNIGVPALDLLKGANSDTVFVIELSSFQTAVLIKTKEYFYMGSL